MLSLGFTEWPQKSWIHFFYSNNVPLKTSSLHIFTAQYCSHICKMISRLLEERKRPCFKTVGQLFLGLFWAVFAPVSCSSAELQHLNYVSHLQDPVQSHWEFAFSFLLSTFLSATISSLQNLKNDAVLWTFVKTLFWIYFWLTAVWFCAPPPLIQAILVA